MKTSLDHLPASKQRELAHVVRVLFEEFEAATNKSNGFGKSRAHPQDRALRLLCARRLGRRSGRRLSVRLRYPDRRQSRQADRLRRLLVGGRGPADARADDHQGAQRPGQLHRPHAQGREPQLEQGRPFFVDIVRQGIALYEAEGFDFAPAARAAARRGAGRSTKHFDRWLPSAETFLQNANDNVARKRPARGGVSISIRQRSDFTTACSGADALQPQIAQAELPALARRGGRARADRGMAARRQVRRGDASSCCGWPMSTRATPPHYKIADEEMRWIGERVAELQRLVKDVCEKRLAPRD